MGRHETVELTLDIIHRMQTDDNFLLSDGDIEAWIPFSQIKNFDDDWDSGQNGIDVEIPVWLAEKVGWI